MSPPRRFGIPTGVWLVGLSASTVLSVAGGIIVGAVHGAWKWMGVPVVIGAAFVAEFVAAIRREARDAELDALVGPLPTSSEVDAIDWELFEQHLRAWSEEG